MTKYPIIDTDIEGNSLELHLTDSNSEYDELGDIYLALYDFYFKLKNIKSYHKYIKINFCDIEKFICKTYDEEAELLNDIMRLLFSYDELFKDKTFIYSFNKNKDWQKEVAEYYEKHLPKLYTNNKVKVELTNE